MGFCWILVYLMWFAHLSVLHAEMCPSNRSITLIIDPSPPPHGTPLTPLPTQCSEGCMTLKCGPRTTVTYLPNKMLCYLEGMLSNMHCCRKPSRQRMGQGNTMQRQNITCKLVRPDHGGTENSDTSSGDDRELIGGIIGTLIVLLLLAVFIVLLIQILRKRQHGHTPPGEGNGYHNSGTKNTYTPREPSPYECPATRWPNSQEYAELEGQGPYGCSNGHTEQYQQHLYEDADKYFRTINDEEFTNPGFEVTGKKEDTQPDNQGSDEDILNPLYHELGKNEKLPQTKDDDPKTEVATENAVTLESTVYEPAVSAPISSTPHPDLHTNTPSVETGNTASDHQNSDPQKIRIPSLLTASRSTQKDPHKEKGSPTEQNSP